MENNNSHKHTNLSEDVLVKIRKGEVAMRPKIYFFLKVAFLIAIAALVIVVAVLLLGFMLFSFKASGQLFLLGFGWHGLGVFFLLFPWKTLLFLVVLLLFLEKLLKRFRFGYRSPVVYLVAGLIAIVLALVFLISLTSFHRTLFHRAREHRLPVVGDYYMHARHVPLERGVVRGYVSEVRGNFFMLDADNDTGDVDESATSSDMSVRVIFDGNVNASSLVKKGDHVFAAGTLAEDGLHVFGLRIILPSEDEE